MNLPDFAASPDAYCFIDTETKALPHTAGTPDEIRNHPEVQAVYLGTETLETIA